MTVEDPPPTSHRTARLLADAGWSELQDRIVMGVCHDLNGRIASLLALRELAEMGESTSGGVADELTRLEAMTGRLAQLVGFVEQPAEPLALAPLVERALALHGRAKGTRPHTVQLDRKGTVPAVLANEGRCLRVLLLFVDRAVTAGGDVRFTLLGDRDGAEMSFATAGALAGEHAEQLERLDAVLRLDGGGIFLERERCALRLPSLRRARAEGR